MEDYKDIFAPLHEKHLEILLYIRDFCSELNIKWCLAYGSALGAMRHGGPVPWDDDTDIYMMVQDYERFRSEFLKRGDRERFYLQENINAGGMIEFAKLRLNNSCFIQPGMQSLDMHHGIYADIFILHPAPQNRLSLLAGRLAGYYVELKRMANQNYSGKKAAAPLMAILRAFPKGFGLKSALKFMYRHDGESRDTLVSWGIPFRIYPKNMLFPAAELGYSGEVLPVPAKTGEYLRYIYGDWRCPPDIETALASVHAAQWSTDRDFRLYAPNIHNFSDEIHIP